MLTSSALSGGVQNRGSLSRGIYVSWVAGVDQSIELFCDVFAFIAALVLVWPCERPRSRCARLLLCSRPRLPTSWRPRHAQSSLSSGARQPLKLQLLAPIMRSLRCETGPRPRFGSSGKPSPACHCARHAFRQHPFLSEDFRSEAMQEVRASDAGRCVEAARWTCGVRCSLAASARRVVSPSAPTTLALASAPGFTRSLQSQGRGVGSPGGCLDPVHKPMVRENGTLEYSLPSHAHGANRMRPQLHSAMGSGQDHMQLHICPGVDAPDGCCGPALRESSDRATCQVRSPNRSSVRRSGRSEAQNDDSRSLPSEWSQRWHPESV